MPGRDRSIRAVRQGPELSPVSQGSIKAGQLLEACCSATQGRGKTGRFEQKKNTSRLCENEFYLIIKLYK
ncbi:MAG: hypothetical protein D3909_13745 [Candidatus Electrothrix sp. ATG1]|nr:hypothetical protein [Candidatus Electrothrix sp. ATG1]MCI5208178.1 hypothetical protein [Candidatus Electrothrix sp. ATG2]